MSPTAVIQPTAGVQAARKQLLVPSPSATMLVEKGLGPLCLPLPSWELGDLELPGFHVLCLDTVQATDMGISPILLASSLIS